MKEEKLPEVHLNLKQETLFIIHEASVIHHMFLGSSGPVACHEYLQLLDI